MTGAAPLLPPPTEPLDVFIVRHGRKYSAFFFGLFATVIVALVTVSVVSLVGPLLAPYVVAIATAAFTAIGTMCSLFLASNAAGDFAHRTPRDQTPTPRASGMFPAQGAPQ